MSSSIYSVRIGPQSSCQNPSEEGAGCARVRVCVPASACCPGRERESCFAAGESVAHELSKGALHRCPVTGLLFPAAGESWSLAWPLLETWDAACAAYRSKRNSTNYSMKFVR